MRKLFRMMLAMMLVALTFSAVSFASEEKEKAEKDEPRVTMSSAWLSSYTDDNGATYARGGVLQSAVGINLFAGLWAEVWNSQSLRKDWEARDLELTLGWTGEVGPAELEFTAAYIDLGTLMKFERGDIWRFTAGAKKQFVIGNGHKLSPFVKGQVYIPSVGNSQEEKGFHVMGGVEYAKSLTEKMDLSQKVTFLYDDGAFGYDRAGIFSYELGLEYKITGPFSLTAGVRTTTPLTKVNDGRKWEVIPAVGIKLGLF